jgi:hypothetical protein
VSFVWRYFRDGAESCGRSRVFEEREEAESWLGERWPKLVSSGIAAVELVEGETVIYRMSLEGEAEGGGRV